MKVQSKGKLRCIHCGEIFVMGSKEAREHEDKAIFDLAFAHGWRGWDVV